MNSAVIKNALSVNGINKRNMYTNSIDYDEIYSYELLYRFLLPYNEWSAFKERVIDANGNMLLNKKSMNNIQKRSFTRFDSIVLKIRKVFEMSPHGNLYKKLPPQTILALLLKESEVPVNVTGSAIPLKDIPLSFMRRKEKKKEKDKEDDGRVIKRS